MALRVRTLDLVLDLPQFALLLLLLSPLVLQSILGILQLSLLARCLLLLRSQHIHACFSLKLVVAKDATLLRLALAKSGSSTRLGSRMAHLERGAGR